MRPCNISARRAVVLLVRRKAVIMKNVYRLLLVLGLVCSLAPNALAKRVKIIGTDNGNTTAPTSKPTPYWTVDAIDLEGKTVTLTKSDGKETQKYKVSAFTKITINGQPDKIENVAAGMKAENMMVSAGTLSALSLVKVKDTDSDGKKNKNKNN